MRITVEQRDFLKRQIRRIKPKSEIYLFGSRVRDEARGGDIDILVLCRPKLTRNEKWQIEFAFITKFGDQKIDLLSYRPEEDQPMKKIALEGAIPL